MAGHNKWSKIKRAKAVTDSRRSKVWARITRDIMVAAREGGGDPGMNARLSLCVDKAKAENMPKENIIRAIKRGTGEIEGQDYVEMNYEGYGPHGIAIFIEALTDNTNRTVADVRHLFTKNGGSLGQNGSVSFMFDRKGIIEVSATGVDELELFELVAEAGADDVEQSGDTFVVTTSVESYGSVNNAVESAGLEVIESGLQRIANTTTKLDPDSARKIANLLEKIEDHQDVQSVYSTLEFDDDTVQALA
jgi:YebC/PmpR family DNA-binding regulatory protein